MDKAGGPVDSYLDIDLAGLFSDIARSGCPEWKGWVQNPKDYPLIEIIKKYSLKVTPGAPE